MNHPIKVYIVRHGFAVDASSDSRRPLAEIGIQEIKSVAQCLVCTGASINTIYHSSKLRAKETADLIAEQVNPSAQRIEREDLDPEASCDNVVREIQGWENDGLLVGHLPFVSKLISRLILEDDLKTCVAMSTGSVVVLERDPSNQWHIIAMFNPRFVIKH